MLKKNIISQWIEKSLETDKFSVEDEGSSQKGDGYIGDVNFVKVIFNDPKKKEKQLSLVIKVSKSDPKIRALSLMMCRTEVVFYNEVFPVLDKFQQEKNVKEPFNAIPKCYKAFIEDDTEIIVLENLRRKGYEMQYFTQPLNSSHIKLVLKNYAKFHAISFALSDQRKAVFKQIVETCKYSFVDIMDGFKPLYDKLDNKAVNYLIEAGKKDLAQKLDKLNQTGCYNNVKKILEVIPEERVVIHGDCHAQNLLFKYQGGDKDNPLAVAFLDFQLSGIHSPMTDLSYFWYFAASTEGFSQFKELMEFYYKELSLSVTELGSDINKIFPISTMWKHWEKYSSFGFNEIVNFLHVFYSEKVTDTITDMMDAAKDEVPIKMVAKNKNDYLERLVTITDHHFNFKIN